MELVRMTVLVVAGSTAVALGIEGATPGLVSCAGRGRGPAIEAATRNVRAHLLMQMLLSPGS